MLKNRIKLSLVDDYVKLVIFENFFNSYISLGKTDVTDKQKQNNRLKGIYEVLFEKLKMNDCSLFLLKQQLKHNNELMNMCNEQTKKDIFKKVFDSINRIEINLKDKLRMLKIDANDLLQTVKIV